MDEKQEKGADTVKEPETKLQSADGKQEKGANVVKKEKKKSVRYFLVKFSGKTNELQAQDVFIGLNGVSRVIQRGVPVILPEPYLEIARHSQIETFDIDMEGNRTPITIANYPFDTICEATEEDYQKMLRLKTPLSAQEIEAIKARSYRN